MKNMKTSISIVLILISVLMLIASIGIITWTRDDPPMHVIPDMDFQPRQNAQSSSDFFDDKRGMQQPPENTVAFGFLKDDDAFYRGYIGDKKDENWVQKIPVKVDQNFLERGQDRYNIFCAVCHDRSGTGKGIAGLKLAVVAKSIHEPHVLAYPDGQLFDIIGNGFQTMMGYKAQINEADRWAIVAYVRALQASRGTKIAGTE